MGRLLSCDRFHVGLLSMVMTDDTADEYAICEAFRQDMENTLAAASPRETQQFSEAPTLSITTAAAVVCSVSCPGELELQVQRAIDAAVREAFREYPVRQKVVHQNGLPPYRLAKALPPRGYLRSDPNSGIRFASAEHRPKFQQLYRKYQKSRATIA